MSELLQEYVDSGSQRLRVDRTAGVIRGVKLLGLRSQNGRRYRENALAEAVGLYEGAKVNINHPKGHPLSPRDYQDRLGVIRGVEFRPEQGLFGDLHFNPKHALSEQLVWDAEHAPQNVGMSHNVLARTTRQGDETVVEAITKVQSIDLVADPATTSGLFEQDSVARSPGTSLDDLDELELHRPDLLRELREAHGDAARTSAIATGRGDRARGDVADGASESSSCSRSTTCRCRTAATRRRASITSDQFVETLLRAADDAALRQLVEERAALVRSADQLERTKRACRQSATRFARSTGRLARRKRHACATPRNSPRRSAVDNSHHSSHFSSTKETPHVANTMRWRYGDTCPVMLPVDSATVIEIGDLVYLDTDDAKPASAQADQGTEAANQELFHDKFAGVAMQASRSGDTQPIRVATTGVFEFDCLSARRSKSAT